MIAIMTSFLMLALIPSIQPSLQAHVQVPGRIVTALPPPTPVLLPVVLLLALPLVGERAQGVPAGTSRTGLRPASRILLLLALPLAQ